MNSEIAVNMYNLYIRLKNKNIFIQDIVKPTLLMLDLLVHLKCVFLDENVEGGHHLLYFLNFCISYIFVRVCY